MKTGCIAPAPPANMSPTKINTISAFEEYLNKSKIPIEVTLSFSYSGLCKYCQVIQYDIFIVLLHYLVKVNLIRTNVF